MLIFMFLSSFLVHSRPPQARNAQFRDKGTTFFAHTQVRKHFFYKKSGKEDQCNHLFHFNHIL